MAMTGTTSEHRERPAPPLVKDPGRGGNKYIDLATRSSFDRSLPDSHKAGIPSEGFGQIQEEWTDIGPFPVTQDGGGLTSA
jgi:hypothetical protein